MGERFWTSDLHLGHARICELAQRPFDSVEEMNEALIERWNAVVHPHDEVLILGDLVMGRFAETIQLVPRLNGRKSLLPGNHDRVHPAYGDDRDRRAHRVARWEAMYYEAGLRILMPVEVRSLSNGIPVVLCHFPYDADDLGRSEYDAHRVIDEGLWLLHGHTHGRGLPPAERNPLNGRQIDVGVDLWDYMPVHEDQLAELIEANT